MLVGKKSARAKKCPIAFFVGAVALAATAVAAVEWPSDFDEELAAHIAAEVSTNTTMVSSNYLEVEPCKRTSASFGFSVVRTPPVKRGSVLIVW